AIAREAGEAQKVLSIGRKRLRLLVGNHLQPVLGAAEEEIALRQLVAHERHDPAAFGELRECADRVRYTKIGLAATGDELLRLGKELDLANAAATDLDVVTGNADLAETLEGMDLALHRVDVGDGGKIEVLAPHEWRELLDEGFTRWNVARHGPRLDHGGALPVLAEAFVVVEGCVRRDCDLRRAGVGAQTEVRAEDIAVAGPLLHEADEIA